MGRCTPHLLEERVALHRLVSFRRFRAQRSVTTTGRKCGSRCIALCRQLVLPQGIGCREALRSGGDGRINLAAAR
jgi:hypothetical protein